MGKVTSLLLLALLAGAAVVVAARRPAPPAAPVASAEPRTSAAGSSTASEGSTAEPAVADAGVASDEPPDVSNDAGTSLPDGSRAPGLPAEAPKQVNFGVILVRYAGAEGARPGTRTKEQALALANELAEAARTDFKAAAQRGDKGSVENAGSMPRGVLEPGPEYVLFTLAKGAVGGPVDTPTGYWVVRRID